MRKLFSLALLSACFVLSPAARATEDGALSLSPAVVMLRGDYGQSTTQTLTLTNGTSRDFSFDLVAQDVVSSGGKRAFADAGSIAGSIAATAVFSQNHVEIPAGKSAAVTMTVTLPPGTPQRAIVALFRGTNRVMSGNTPITASLGGLLTFAVSDDVRMKAAPLTIQPQTGSANLAVRQACTNEGREPLVARGVLAVLDGNGALIGKSPIAQHRLLPGESADLGGEYAGELGPGHYRLFVTYDYEGRTLTQSAEVDVK